MPKTAQYNVRIITQLILILFDILWNEMFSYSINLRLINFIPTQTKKQGNQYRKRQVL